MRDPLELFEMAIGVDVPFGLPLIAGLSGSLDAGSASASTMTHLREISMAQNVAIFDPDELFDYRARRPLVTFTEDHLSDYRPPRLALDLAGDEMGSPFLVFSGYEPDFQWHRFAEATIRLIAKFGVSSTTWINSIPMPVPHTRPLGFTVSGNRDDLRDAMSVWKPTSEVSASAFHLVEHRLVDLGHPTVSFVVHTPHYLADTEYPGATIAALEAISAATGLIFPTDALRAANRSFIANIDQQVAENEELGRMVAALETRHDDYMQGNAVQGTALADASGSLPSADEIAAEFERFLSFRPSPDSEH